VPLHLEAIRLDSELYAEDFETHIQTFEHARALPQLLDVLPAVELSPFEDSARLIVRLCADVLRDHPDSAAAPKLVPHLLQIFPSQRSQLRDDAQKLGLPFAESSEGGGHGEK